MKICRYCERPVKFDKLNRQRGFTCGSDDCRRKLRRDQKRRSRDKKRNPGLVEPEPDEGYGVREDGSVVTPFGEFPTVLEAELEAAWRDLEDEKAVPYVDTCPDVYNPPIRGKRYSWRAWWLVDNDIASDDPLALIERIREGPK